MSKVIIKSTLMLILLLSWSCSGDDPMSVSASCEDGIINGSESGIDCGGDCAACPTCDDGIMNGTEEGVDCGGFTCQLCPRCDDYVMNGNEEGIDCGGDCGACASVIGLWKVESFDLNGDDVLVALGISDAYYNFLDETALENASNAVNGSQSTNTTEYTVDFSFKGMAFAEGNITIGGNTPTPISGTFRISDAELKIDALDSNSNDLDIVMRKVTTDLCAGVTCSTGVCSYGICI